MPAVAHSDCTSRVQDVDSRLYGSISWSWTLGIDSRTVGGSRGVERLEPTQPSQDSLRAAAAKHSKCIAITTQARAQVIHNDQPRVRTTTVFHIHADDVAGDQRRVT